MVNLFLHGICQFEAWLGWNLDRVRRNQERIHWRSDSGDYPPNRTALYSIAVDFQFLVFNISLLIERPHGV